MLWKVDSAAPAPLQEQIAANIRRGIADGTLARDERLPPAGELATVLQVNANTVLAAYRRLRDEGLLEFRRGRGVRVRADSLPAASLADAVHQLLELGRRHGYSPGDIAELVTTLGDGKP